MLLMPRNYSIRDLHRFWAFRAQASPAECWPWTGTVRTGIDSYGSVREVTGRFKFRGVTYAAPRVAYYFEYREDPGRFLVCHECNNPLCVNPGHLFLGTNGDNQKHRKDSGRHQFGSQAPTAILTEELVPEIRRRLDAGETCRAIGKDYGVHQNTIASIKSRVNWSHVP